MRYVYPLLCIALLLLSACGPVQATEQVDAGMPVPGESPTEMVVSTVSPESPTDPTVPPLTTYTDSANGFSFDYPSAWMLDTVALGDRAPLGIQLTSWAHEPGMVSEVVEGGTIMNINVQLWDPKSDLEAFAATRLQAWEASGFPVVSQEEFALVNGQMAKEFVVQAPDGLSYFLLTTLGDNYLIASGSGDIETIRLVARSMR